MTSASEWDDLAATYDEAEDHGLRTPATRDAWRALLLGLLPPAPARVADLGCATGTLTLLLSEAGYAVDAIDRSAPMLRRARAKLAGRTGVTIEPGDAAAPPLPAATYDAVLCRHVLWTLPDQPSVLERWAALLAPGGRLVLIEGSWHTGAGLTADETSALVAGLGRTPVVHPLSQVAALWGGAVDDERYAVVG